MCVMRLDDDLKNCLNSSAQTDDIKKGLQSIGEVPFCNCHLATIGENEIVVCSKRFFYP